MKLIDKLNQAKKVIISGMLQKYELTKIRKTTNNYLWIIRKLQMHSPKNSKEQWKQMNQKQIRKKIRENCLTENKRNKLKAIKLSEDEKNHTEVKPTTLKSILENR